MIIRPYKLVDYLRNSFSLFKEFLVKSLMKKYIYFYFFS